MIRRIGWLTATLWLALLAAPDPSFAQLEDNLLGLTDENLDGYLSPLNTGLSGTMNAAIFRTGYVPEAQFDFTIGVAAMAVGFGDEDRVFTPTDPGFTPLESTGVPTVVGDPAGVLVEGVDGYYRSYPGGFDMGGFEIAVPQLSLGCVQGTRAVLRYIALDLGDADIGEFSYFGIGGQHSISQWMWSHNPPVDLAAGVFVQNFKIGDDIVKANAFHFSLTASKQFSIVQPYLGIGYDSAGLKIDIEDEDDPEVSIDADLDNETNAHLTLGLLAKLQVASVFFEFNAAAASGFAVGLDFGTIGGANHAQDTM
jgi:hypothetical protein